MKKIDSLVLSTITAFALIGCGGGGGSGGGNTSGGNTPTTQTATLIDDKVSGVKYVNGTASGFTNSNGEFPYTSGLVSFYVGDIKLGEISTIPSDKNVFIQDIVGVSRTDSSNPKVLKIASLLQSLDSDNSTDKIEIKETDFDKFKNQSITSIDENSDINSLLTTLNITKVSDTNAKRHLDNSLKYYSVTSDTTAPTLTTSSITNGATNVSTNANIVLTFSEDIRKDMINKDNITLVDSSSNNIDFTIFQNSNIITITPKNLNYATTYNLTLKSNIQDYAKNSLGSADTVISFNTQAQPDTNAPVITSASSFSVNENQTSAFTVTATDSSVITYSLEGTDASSFTINPTTGVVNFKSAPDYETKTSYSLTVKATDSSNNSSAQNVTVNITDVVDGTGVFKTGQTISYAVGDDGYYASTLGVARSFTRDATKEIVTDNITKLQWQDDATASTTRVDWTTATTSTCQNLSLGGYSDWRLPTIEELESIVRYNEFMHRRYAEFLNFASGNYWSSIPTVNLSSYAWVVYFFDGSDSWGMKTDSNYVRCVRAGQ